MGGTVPLSEHEQRQLEQIEQALYADYPRFANAVRASDPRVHYKRRVVQAAFGFLIGVGLLLTGVMTYVLIGVAGFVVMLGSSMWAVNSYRHMTGFAPSLLAGAVMTLVFYRAGISGFLPGVWLLLYGAAVLAGGYASVRVVPIMGVCFMLVGTVALFLPGWNDVLLTIGFGGLHLMFGTVIAVKYGG